MYLVTEIRHQITRSRLRSCLGGCIAMMLVLSMALYIGNIQTSEATLQNLADTIPVSATIVSRDGSRDVGLEISQHHFDGIMQADIKDPLYTASAGAIWAEKYRVDEVKSVDTNISGANSAQALVGIDEENVLFTSGWDLSFLEGRDGVCIISELYARNNDLEIGDRMTLPFYVPRYNDDGFSVRFDPVGEQTVQVIGIYSVLPNAVADPMNMIVPIRWLKDIVETSGITFYYASFQCTLSDPMNLNLFKEAVSGSNFAEISEQVLEQHRGDALIVDDQLFIETAEELQKNIKVLRWFLFPFFAVIIVLITLTSFLILRSTQRDMAIARSLGRSKSSILFVYFFSVLIPDLAGSILVGCFLLFTTSLTIIQVISILGLFLTCSCIGVLSALAMLMRFDALALLTKTD